MVVCRLRSQATHQLAFWIVLVNFDGDVFYAAFVVVVFLIVLIRRPGTAAMVAVGYGMVVWCFLVIAMIYTTALLTSLQPYISNDIVEQFSDSFYRWLFYSRPMCVFSSL